MLAKKDSLNLFSDACTVLRSEDCTWSVDRKFLDKKSTEVSVAVAFNGYCFIYERETMKCITMFRLPKNFGQKKTYYKADKRKYKYNFDYCEYDDEDGCK